MKLEKDSQLKEKLVSLLEESQKSSTLSLGEILKILSGKGRSLILIFLSLPFCQPLQIPGLSTPFGIVIAFFALRLTFGKNIWLPKKILAKNISSKVIQKIIRKSLLMMNKMRFLIHPRMVWLCDNRVMRVASGLLIFFCGLFLALPLPIPLTNLAVGWAIFSVSLGLLERDGLFVIIGYLISLLLLAVILFALISVNFFK